MEELKLESKIEGILFYKGDLVSKNELALLLNVSNEEIEQAVNNLKEILKNRGLIIIDNNDYYKLGVTNEIGPLIESIHKEEISKELTKASIETLAIIIYYNGVARSEIDYIRGVNSSFIIRNLLVRGLVEKKIDIKDSRRFLYYPTIELLSYLGVSNISELPNYNDIKKQLEETLSNQIKNEEKND